MGSLTAKVLNPLSICIVAGEPSGDRLGGALVEALHAQDPSFSFWGMGGPYLKDAGMSQEVSYEGVTAMGLWAVVRRLPNILSTLKRLRDSILERNPLAVVLIDFPTFNLRLAKQLRHKGYQGKIFFYVCPTIWAHSPNRIQAMEKSLDLVLSIYPFECDYFSQSSLSCVYVGNPVHQRILEAKEMPDSFLTDLSSRHPMIGLFPGSRPSDIQAHLPKILDAARLILLAKPEVRFGLSCVHSSLHDLLHTCGALEEDPLQVGKTLFLVDERLSTVLMRCSQVAIAKSGTVTLELALLSVPTVVVYWLSPFVGLLGRLLMGLRLPYYCIVNILMKKEVFPELLIGDFEPSKVARAVLGLIGMTRQRQECLQACHQLRDDLMTDCNPSIQAAHAILSALKP